MTTQHILELVKQAILSFEPDAEIILFGSRARGDASSESDWDFLVLLDGVVDNRRVERIWDQVYEVELVCGEVLSVLVRSHQDWQLPIYQVMPIHERITAEGVRL